VYLSTRNEILVQVYVISRRTTSGCDNLFRQKYLKANPPVFAINTKQPGRQARNPTKKKISTKHGVRAEKFLALFLAPD
jgi:hypothetical protein